MSSFSSLSPLSAYPPSQTESPYARDGGRGFHRGSGEEARHWQRDEYGYDGGHRCGASVASAASGTSYGDSFRRRQIHSRANSIESNRSVMSARTESGRTSREMYREAAERRRRAARRKQAARRKAMAEERALLEERRARKEAYYVGNVSMASAASRHDASMRSQASQASTASRPHSRVLSRRASSRTWSRAPSRARSRDGSIPAWNARQGSQLADAYADDAMISQLLAMPSSSRPSSRASSLASAPSVAIPSRRGPLRAPRRANALSALIGDGHASPKASPKRYAGYRSDSSSDESGDNGSAGMPSVCAPSPRLAPRYSQPRETAAEPQLHREHDSGGYASRGQAHRGGAGRPSSATARAAALDRLREKERRRSLAKVSADQFKVPERRPAPAAPPRVVSEFKASQLAEQYFTRHEPMVPELQDKVGLAARPSTAELAAKMQGYDRSEVQKLARRASAQPRSIVRAAGTLRGIVPETELSHEEERILKSIARLNLELEKARAEGSRTESARGSEAPLAAIRVAAAGVAGAVVG
ncbi:uncharacterized protein AMSG_05164 [Thecamonas trahens ATCC 50062]|uniref:Uncharacterized protein n=1 Tax=Thecamonas trahens ATCC 50062 TaxID=461836 RepID=A0A0L0DCY2_THETB|nr:hypothetical protein AMSG_05164 [Thecamonas trahens ATCC 50062]KNC49183.1 hypothetical protein AMSG_05164 [Thecamonas trahens ATCC 50062]|eukprot:XP_013758203.1 hypothetical protein AMSG_05164 [Thecamonas trahens ATCC 50062]